jgi:peptide/nickel transport system substrate-binding protein
VAINNFDEIRWISMVTARCLRPKAGEISAGANSRPKHGPVNMASLAVQRGDVIKSTFPHSKPSGMTGFAINTPPRADDWRVREALIQAFNFEYINARRHWGALPRISSESNSTLAMQPGPAPQAVRVALPLCRRSIARTR